MDLDGNEKHQKERITAAAYFQRKEGVGRIDPNLPAIRAEGFRDCVYPVECVKILPNQRLPLSKMTENISRDLLRVF